MSVHFYSGSGNPFDQDLNTFNDVTFNSVTTDIINGSDSHPYLQNIGGGTYALGDVSSSYNNNYLATGVADVFSNDLPINISNGYFYDGSLAAFCQVSFGNTNGLGNSYTVSTNFHQIDFSNLPSYISLAPFDNWDATENWFPVPITGVYLFNFQARLSDIRGADNVAVGVSTWNGSDDGSYHLANEDISFIWTPVPATGKMTLSVSCVRLLNVDDKVIASAGCDLGTMTLSNAALSIKLLMPFFI
jgi:hypothetical protein